MSLIADVVFASAAAAFAHFGVSYDVPEREQPRAERTVARTKARRAEPMPLKVEDCPEKRAAIHRI
jgi:glutathione S-transferase